MSYSPHAPLPGSGEICTAEALAIPGLTEELALPLICRWPAKTRPKGFAIFCHGLGASGGHYVELSARWAAAGYLVIHPTFADWAGAVIAAEPELGLPAGTDTSGWMTDPRIRPRMYEVLHDPHYATERIRIVSATMDHLDAILAATCGAPGAPGAPLKGAITGHSFGAYTSQLLAGAEIDLPGAGATNFRDPRFSAAILLSAQGRDQQGLREGSWDGITGPMLNVTGTLDGGAKGQDWHWKTEPYDFAPPGDKYQAVLDASDHFLGGIAAPGQSPVPEQRDAVFALTRAFLDAYLAQDAEARGWLAAVGDHVGSSALQFSRK